MAGRQDDAQWRTAGDRIQTLVDACAASGTAAHERAEQLVREVVELYGAGLERIVGVLDAQVVEQLSDDDLVASLLLVHGLHPQDTHQRVTGALEKVRPYLGSHGGDVALREVTDDGVVRLQFSGSCKSCPSSAVTLEYAVEDAVRAAAPEIAAIEVVSAEPDTSGGVIPAESLLTRIHPDQKRTSWHPVPEMADLAPGEVGGFVVADTTVLACRIGEQVLVYRDHCPVCDDSLAGAALDDTLLRCPRCRADFDVVHAGAGVGGSAAHLDPIPLLTHGGALSVALPTEALGVSA
jgi:Fe-S cluster biogenesis protein NfuA/nitrite reductase/ring-hydroxylating ferredoxin subunit